MLSLRKVTPDLQHQYYNVATLYRWVTNERKDFFGSLLNFQVLVQLCCQM